MLGSAYLAYGDVKRCYEARESYAVGYLTYQEMELARNTVRQIEDAMRPKLDPGTTTDDIWSAYMTGQPSGRRCHRASFTITGTSI